MTKEGIFSLFRFKTFTYFLHLTLRRLFIVKSLLGRQQTEFFLYLYNLDRNVLS